MYIGKVTVYLAKRDFVDHLEYVDPIDGIVVVENDYLQGRKVLGQVSRSANVFIRWKGKLKKKNEPFTN